MESLVPAIYTTMFDVLHVAVYKEYLHYPIEEQLAARIDNRLSSIFSRP